MGIVAITISQRLALPEFHSQELRLGQNNPTGWSLHPISALAEGTDLGTQGLDWHDGAAAGADTNPTIEKILQGSGSPPVGDVEPSPVGGRPPNRLRNVTSVELEEEEQAKESSEGSGGSELSDGVLVSPPATISATISAGFVTKASQDDQQSSAE